MLECRRRILQYRRGRRQQAGFSLIELLVTILILAEILVGLLILFDTSNRLARAQTHLAELQQSLRVGQFEVTRFARMAGIGGLPITRENLPVGQPDGTNADYDLSGVFPNSGYAVSVLNNVDEATIVQVVDPSATDLDGDLVVPGSDVLIVRGVFSTPIYYLDPPLDVSTWLDDGEIEDETLIIPEKMKIGGESYEDYPQDIDVLAERLTAAAADSDATHRPVGLILRDTTNPEAYMIVEFDHETSTPGTDLVKFDCPGLTGVSFMPKCIRVHVRLDPDSAPGESYGELSQGTGLRAGGMTLELDPGPPVVDVELPTKISSIGLLEEVRIFVRAEWEIPGDRTTRLTPVLSRAHFLPGTNVQTDRIDIADNVADLQVAVGIDTDTAGAGFGRILDDGTSGDEVLFNSSDDVDAAGNIVAPPRGETWYDPALSYHFLRINTLVQARSPDTGHRAPQIAEIEDFNRGNAFVIDGRTYRFNNENFYRRRWLQTVVEMRNLQ